jgi:hypothetical protein
VGTFVARVGEPGRELYLFDAGPNHEVPEAALRNWRTRRVVVCRWIVIHRMGHILLLLYLFPNISIIS